MTFIAIIIAPSGIRGMRLFTYLQWGIFLKPQPCGQVKLPSLAKIEGNSKVGKQAHILVSLFTYLPISLFSTSTANIRQLKTPRRLKVQQQI